jgi:hypothetical protein
MTVFFKILTGKDLNCYFVVIMTFGAWGSVVVKALRY